MTLRNALHYQRDKIEHQLVILKEQIYELSDESKIAFINSANFKKNTMKQLNKIREPIIKRRNMTDPKKYKYLYSWIRINIIKMSYYLSKSAQSILKCNSMGK